MKNKLYMQGCNRVTKQMFDKQKLFFGRRTDFDLLGVF